MIRDEEVQEKMFILTLIAISLAEAWITGSRDVCKIHTRTLQNPHENFAKSTRELCEIHT